MNKHEGHIRGYFRHSKAWCAGASEKKRIQVSFGMYAPDWWQTSGAMEMEWKRWRGRLFPELKCEEDGWSALSLFTDLIQKMGEVDSKHIQEEDFCKMLDECGFKDLTPYTKPNQNDIPF